MPLFVSCVRCARSISTFSRGGIRSWGTFWRPRGPWKSGPGEPCRTPWSFTELWGALRSTGRPKTAPDLSKTAGEIPERAQRRPKGSPRQPKRVPGRPKGAKRTRLDARYALKRPPQHSGGAEDAPGGHPTYTAETPSIFSAAWPAISRARSFTQL